MSVVSVRARSFILALFIRDDGERFLLGDRGYDFKEDQLHFAGNSIENDEVANQGADGVLLAGQVRRSSVQSFDGFVGDATNQADQIEQMRRDFIGFFAKNHHYRVVYIDVNSNAWQRKNGYLVDAPEVQELYQVHPEYHVALNFEDVNYYQYDENADGDEILSNIVSVPISTEADGGLVWDEDGAVSEDADVEHHGETATSERGNPLVIASAAKAPFTDLTIFGEGSQNGTPTTSVPIAVQTVSGENVVEICGKNLFDKNAATLNYRIGSDGSPYGDSSYFLSEFIPVNPSTQYRITPTSVGGSSAIAYYDSSKTFISRTLGGTWYNVSTPANCAFIRFTTLKTLIDSAQCELGSSASSFEPYQEQSYNLNLNPNLFDSNASKEGYYLDSSGNEVADASWQISDYILISPTKNYKYTGITVQDANVYAVFYNSSKSFVSSFQLETGDQQLYIAAGRYYVRFSINNTDENSFVFNKYSEELWLCGLGDDGNGGFEYEDKIYQDSDGVWKIHKEVDRVRVESGGVSRSSMSNVVYARFQKKTADNSRGNTNYYPGLFSHAVWGTETPASWNTEETIGKIYCTNQTTSYAVGFPAGTTLAQVKSALNGSEAYYSLKTPTDSPIYDQAVISQLEEIKALGTIAGVNTITITPKTGAPGELQVGYYTEYEDIVKGGGYIWDNGGYGGPTIINTDSIYDTYPTWTVLGPVYNPALENITTGDSIEYVGVISDGQKLVIDMAAQTAELDGLNVIANVVGDWLRLAHGENKMIYSSDTPGAGPSEIGWSDIVG